MQGNWNAEWSRTWTLIAVIWALLLCFMPDPRPLSTPAWSINLVTATMHVQEPAARVIAAIAMRMFLLGVLGMLMMRASGGRHFRRGALVVLVLAPIIGIITLWVNHQHFPIDSQLKLAVVATVAGGLATMLLRRNWWAGGLLMGVLGLTLGMLVNYRVSDDLANIARIHVDMLLEVAPSVPDGDAAFLQLTHAAFDLAAQRSRNGDPVLESQAAVLGLALVLGDEKLAKAADRYVDPARVPECEAIRVRTTLHDRPDWSRHFWVSAGLVVLSGESRSLSVGIIKEMKDANAGGSGFSFGDLTADAAGDRFALAATRSVPDAVALQKQILEGPIAAKDFMPDARGLPEGIYADAFEQTYSGVGGERTDSLVSVIREQLKTCQLLY